jgi:acyl carrier protein
MSDTNAAEIDKAELAERLLAIISKEGLVPREKLQLDARLDQLDVHSVDMLSILMAVEEQFGIYIPVDADLSEMKTVEDLVNALAKRIAEKPAAQ